MNDVGVGAREYIPRRFVCDCADTCWNGSKAYRKPVAKRERVLVPVVGVVRDVLYEETEPEEGVGNRIKRTMRYNKD